MLIGGALVSVIAYSVLFPPLTEFYNSLIIHFNNIRAFLSVHFYQIILAVLLFIIISRKFYFMISRKIAEIRYHRKRIASEVEKIEEFLSKDFRKMIPEELESYVNNFQIEKRKFLDESMTGYLRKMDIKFTDLKKVLVELKHKNELEKIRWEKSQTLKEIEYLKKEKLRIENNKEFKRQDILEKLDILEKDVFKIDRLKKEEIKILKEEKFKQINEYCVFDQKIIPVLMKRVLNHSYRHTFLVWSVRKLLNDYAEITNVQQHDTRDADLTFNIDRKKYAIEIETGSLLKKKDQLNKKIEFLKRKYKKRWIILVSNRDSMKHYKKFGWCTQRKDMRKNLEKLIQI